MKKYFYMLLDKGDRVLLGEKEVYTVSDKGSDFLTLENITDKDTWKLSAEDLEKFLMTLDGLSELTVEFSDEKKERFVKERAQDIAFRMEDRTSAAARYALYTDKLKGYGDDDEHE